MEKKVLLHVYTQFTNDDGKPKGGQQFNFRVDPDTFGYADKDEREEVLQELINEKMKGWEGSYKVMETEMVFFEPIEVEGFEELYAKKMELKCN